MRATEIFSDEQGVAVASARAGNVIGGGDWSADRLIPDTARFLAKERNTKIRRPNAIRPWQHVLEPLAGYLTLAEQLENASLAGAYNFGPPTQEALPSEMIELAQTAYGNGTVQYGDGRRSARSRLVRSWKSQKHSIY